jgi:hydrogenase nickel incorporation protein HypA/HybF
MHEMGIVAGILEAAENAAKHENAVRINKINIKVGELTEIVDDALQFAWESLSPGTLAEGAELVVERVSPRSRCHQCDVTFDHGRFDAACPECDMPLCELVQGRELLIESLDIDLPDDVPAEETS